MLLEIQTEDFAQAFATRPTTLRHRLTEHPLLTVEAIAELAESLPETKIEHNLGSLPTVVPTGEVPRAALPPAEIARGIETNGCWMVLKNIELVPDYAQLLDASLDEVASHVGGRDGGMGLREGFIFLSAPGSVTPSHTDPEHNLLLQNRGTKEMTLGEFPDASTRQLVLENSRHRNIDWEPANPRTYALTPGDGVYVPVHAPHWVKNGDTVSVSLSITFQTPASERDARVHALNARIRRLGLSPRPPREHAATDKAKAAVHHSLTRLRELV
jgi:hypothetical protein